MPEPGIEELLSEAAGFGACGRCPYLTGGSPELCFRCANRTIEPLADWGRRCKVCDQTYAPGEVGCKNPVCSMSRRWFGWNYAVAIRSGMLQRVIDAYKLSDAMSDNRGWAAIFGRILVGFLDANASAFEGIDLIIASPTYTGPRAHRRWDHIRDILVAANTEQGSPARWPFDVAEPPVIIKTAETERMRHMKYQQRRVNAEGPLREALQVPDPTVTAGMRLIVVDDVFTDGLTLREVARALVEDGGAAEVNGVTLARQPFGRNG